MQIATVSDMKIKNIQHFNMTKKRINGTKSSERIYEKL